MVGGRWSHCHESPRRSVRRAHNLGGHLLNHPAKRPTQHGSSPARGGHYTRMGRPTPRDMPPGGPAMKGWCGTAEGILEEDWLRRLGLSRLKGLPFDP